MIHEGKTCMIITGGKYSPIRQTETTEYVIACDKGYEYALQEGIEPDLIMGDFDSCSEIIKGQVERYPSEKDDTDTMLAIKRALELGYRRIELCCALGGRIDHMYANIQSLVYAAKRGAIAYMEDEENYICAMGVGKIELPKRDGWSVSIFAATDVCGGITTTGLKYALKEGSLINSFPLGVSNEWESELATIEVKEGILLLVLADKGV